MILIINAFYKMCIVRRCEACMRANVAVGGWFVSLYVLWLLLCVNYVLSECNLLLFIVLSTHFGSFIHLKIVNKLKRSMMDTSVLTALILMFVI